MTVEPPVDPDPPDYMADAARKAAERARRGRADPGPSMGAELGQIGVLGWMVVLPMLVGVFAGRWLDHHAGTSLVFTAALVMIGAAIGMWTAWRWMHRKL